MALSEHGYTSLLRMAGDLPTIKPMQTWVELGTGLGQGKISNGMLKLIRGLKLLPNVKYHLRSYKDWEQVDLVAKEIADWWIADPDFRRVIVTGHSFGFWLQTLLMKSLLVHGTPIYAALSADGVNRPLNKPLFITPNVQNLYAWYQLDGVIHGSDFIINSGHTKFVINRQVYKMHPFVDEVKEYQNTVIQLAKVA